MIITVIKCKICNVTIFSRCRHDFHSCKCGNCSIDGGREYVKISYKNSNDYEIKEINIQQTQRELYDDWRTETNRYGTMEE